MPLLGSGGGPARALPLLDAERFLIVNGDTLTDCDLRAVAEQHVQTGALVTMALVEKDVERLVMVDGHDTVRGFANKRALAATNPGSDAFLHFIGVQAVNASVFAGVPRQPGVREHQSALSAAHHGSSGNGSRLSDRLPSFLMSGRRPTIWRP